MLASLRCCLFQEKTFWKLALLLLLQAANENGIGRRFGTETTLIFRELWDRVMTSFLNIQTHFQFCTGGQRAHRRPLPMCRSKLPPACLCVCLLWRACFQHSSLQLITPPVAVKSAFEDALDAGLYHLIVQSMVPRSNVLWQRMCGKKRRAPPPSPLPRVKLPTCWF